MSALRKVTAMLSDGIRASIIMGLGDVIAQTYVDKKKVDDIDWKRTGKFAGIGLLYVGPTLHLWYGFLNKIIARKQPALQRTLKKMAIDQIAFAPFYTLSLMAVFGLVNKKSSDEIRETIKSDFKSIMKQNYILWPAAQIINFGLVPISYQVTFAQVIAVIWNTYLSSVFNSTSSQYNAKTAPKNKLSGSFFSLSDKKEAKKDEKKKK